MAQFGTYDPTDNTRTSSLFSYGEVPLESAKLNRWNGNLAAALARLSEQFGRLAAEGAGPHILWQGTGQELLVCAQTVPDLTVKIQPGAMLLDGVIAGCDAVTPCPAEGNLTAPTTHPRIDVVYLTTTGALGVQTGTEAAEPEAPALSEGTTGLAQLCWRVGATQILDSDDGSQAYLVDVRPAGLRGLAHVHGTDRQPGETPDGSRTAFTTGADFLAGTLDVYLNGVLQAKDSDYSEADDGSGYVFTTAPHPGDRIEHRYRKG